MSEQTNQNEKRDTEVKTIYTIAGIIAITLLIIYPITLILSLILQAMTQNN